MLDDKQKIAINQFGDVVITSTTSTVGELVYEVDDESDGFAEENIDNYFDILNNNNE